MSKEPISQAELFKLFYERKTLSWVQLGEMFSFTTTNETSREVLGAIGNLVVDGFVEKLPGITPPIWKITKSGMAEYSGRPLSEAEMEIYNQQVHDLGGATTSMEEFHKAQMSRQTFDQLKLELDKSRGLITKAYLLARLAIGIAVLSLIILLVLSKYHT